MCCRCHKQNKDMSNLEVSGPENVWIRKNSRKPLHRQASAVAKEELLSVYKEDGATIHSENKRSQVFCFVLFFNLRWFRSWKGKSSPDWDRNGTSNACSCCLLPALGQSGTYTAQHRVLVGGGCGLSSQEAERPAFCKAKAWFFRGNRKCMGYVGETDELSKSELDANLKGLPHTLKMGLFPKEVSTDLFESWLAGSNSCKVHLWGPNTERTRGVNAAMLLNSEKVCWEDSH